VLRAYDRVLIPEMNLGQLWTMVRAQYLVDAQGLNKIMGRPFTAAEIAEKIEELSR
jgi:2-oxoglutarate ferredoxin oxidoreductase subunit alpha